MNCQKWFLLALCFLSMQACKKKQPPHKPFYDHTRTCNGQTCFSFTLHMPNDSVSCDVVIDNNPNENDVVFFENIIGSYSYQSGRYAFSFIKKSPSSKTTVVSFYSIEPHITHQACFTSDNTPSESTVGLEKHE